VPRWYENSFLAQTIIRFVVVGVESLGRLFAMNLMGAFFCCQEAAKRLTEGGRIINGEGQVKSTCAIFCISGTAVPQPDLRRQ
jgi:hypothetical protein